MLAVEGLLFLVFLCNMVEHRILLFTRLGAMRAHKLTCFVLCILCGHAVTRMDWCWCSRRRDHSIFLLIHGRCSAMNEIIGYTASSTTVVAYGIQFVHTIQCGTVEGLSLSRTLLDTASLGLWVLYATRTEDIPLLIATSCELFMSLCVTGLIARHKFCRPKESCLKPDITEQVVINVKPTRRNSVWLA